MSQTFLKRIQCLREDTTVSAQRAVDFYEGDQTRLMEEVIRTPGIGITDASKRGVMVLWVNYVLQVIRQSSHTYDTQPKREVFVGDTVNEDLTQLYNDILKDAGFIFASQSIDELSRLLKSTLLLVQGVEETESYNLVALGPHNSDVEWDSTTGTVKSIMYATCDPGLKGGQMFRLMTPETITDVEFLAATDTEEARTRTGGEVENPYGIITASPLFDVRPPSSGFWSKPAWEELVSFNEALNMFNIEAKFGSRFGLLGMPVTNAKIADGTVMSPDAVITVEQENPEIPIFFEFRAPQVQIDAFMPWLESLTQSIGQGWGVTFDPDGNGSAESGFALMVRELPNTELRQTRRKAAVPFEEKLFEVLKTMHSVDFPSSTQFPEDSTLKVEFTAPLTVVNENEVSERAAKEIANGTLSRVEYVMQRDKITRVEAEEKIVIIDAERKIVTPAPEFPE